MEKENRLRDHHLIERANELKMEQMQEIKKLNQHIIQVSEMLYTVFMVLLERVPRVPGLPLSFGNRCRVPFLIKVQYC